MANTLPSSKYYLSSFIFIVFITLLQQPVIAQAKKEISRVAVVVENNRTNIWISDFPKQATVMLFDEQDNLLGLITTNEYGAAYTSLQKTISTTLYAKTLNGEVKVCNKAIFKSDHLVKQVAMVGAGPINKA